MDFGVLSMLNKACSITNQESHGSGVVKQETSVSTEDRIWRATKQLKTDELMLLRSGSVLSYDDNDVQNMLSFSSSTKPSQVNFLGCGDSASKASAFPFFLPRPDPVRNRASGFSSGGSRDEVRGASAMFKGPLSPSQWMELEHQALIYKHIVSNVPVPANLLIPLKKALNPYAFSGLSYGSYTTSLGWGSFHLGFSSNTDPEPGRCRRTDGKKWRCSRDAVPDQKYCERHINRGRHRSRKPVEGQKGHAVSGSTASVVAPNASSSALVMSSSSASSNLGVMQHQVKSSQQTATNSSTNHVMNSNLKSNDCPFPVQKTFQFEESPKSEFGFVSSNALLNPSERNSYTNYRTSSSPLCFSDHHPKERHSLNHFTNDLSKEQRNTPSWPDLRSDWTQLSISIPVAPSDFSSSPNSPGQENFALSSRRQYCNFDAVAMGLEVNDGCSEPIQKRANCLPVPWENSMGGPLGEVLNSTTGNVEAAEDLAAQNITTTEAWGGSSQLGSSPTGKKKSTFVSLSNSSSGSSSRAENKAPDGSTIFDDEVLVSKIASS